MTIESFECPIVWCRSSIHEHGGDGAYPTEWEHWGEPENLVPGLWGTVEAQGTSDARYLIGHDPDWDEEIHDSRSLRSLALIYEEAADRLRQRARDLERINA